MKIFIIFLVFLINGCVTSSDYISKAEKKFIKKDLSWPLQGIISSPYGMRHGGMHYGIDIAAPKGTPVTSAASGRVVFAGWQHGYGRTVILKHRHYYTLYGHLNKLAVKKGDVVWRGEYIGRVGTSGNSTGPHLHFEYRTLKGSRVNPLYVLRKKRRHLLFSKSQ